MSEKKSFLGKIDRQIFLISAIITVVFVAWTLLQPVKAGEIFSATQNFIASNLGWSYLIGVTLFVIFGFVFAFSKYGNIVLGKDGEKPEFGIMSWFAMLFACGMGIGLVFWGVAEPLTHFGNPPYGEPSTIESAKTAMRYTYFHWGMHPWATFAIVGLAMAYFQFRKGLPALISTTLIPVIGEKGAKGWFGKLVDTLAVFATIFGIATSLGLGAMQIASGLNFSYGVSSGVWTQAVIIIVKNSTFIKSIFQIIKKK